MKKSNLLSATGVFSFVAFCFAIANTFGNTYAVSVMCPSGWTYVESRDRCMYNSNFDDGDSAENKTACEKAITDLGLTVDYSGYEKFNGETVLPSNAANYCLRADNGFYSGYISTDNYTYYTITFDGNGGTVANSTSVKAGTSATLPTPTPPSGKKFLHWQYTNEDNRTYTYAAGYKLTVNRDLTLTAIYTDMDTYTLTYNANGGTIKNTVVSPGGTTHTTWDAIYNENQKVTDLITDEPQEEGFQVLRSGHTFKGWSTSTACSSYLSNGFTIEEDMTIYACWSSNNSGGDGGTTTPTTYKVIFGALTDDYLQNAVLLKNGSIITNHTISNLTSSSFNVSNYSATSDNYEFTHWSYGECDNEDSTLTGTITLRETTTNIYACWKAKTTNNENPPTTTNYTVTFNLNNGTLYYNNNKTTTKTYQLTSIDYSKYTAKKEGYVFKGWRTTNESCNDAVIKGTDKLTEDLRLYACYTEESGGIIENPNTGSSLLYIVFLTGILALGYTSYSTYGYIKSKNN